jgi:Tol biopolymer transport system component
MLFVTALLATGVLLCGTGSGAAQSASVTATINGRIAFDSSRPPGDLNDHLIYSMAADGSDLQGPLTATDVFAPDLDSGEATFSPDGTKIAYYTKNFAGSGGDLPCCAEIAVMNTDGTDRQLLINGHGTTDCGFNDQPTWSPDGREIAFVTCAPGSGFTAIGVVNADGSGFHFLLTTTNFNAIYHPSWSPDGTTIAYTHLDTGGIPHIVTTSATGGGGETELGLGYDPAWSPDGTKLAFDHPSGENDTGIWVMNADGSNPVRLTSSEDARPAWSPDGTKIAFQSRREGNGWQIYTMNADGSNQTRLTNEPGVNNEWPTWGRAPSQDVVVDTCSGTAAVPSDVQGDLTIENLNDCGTVNLGNVDTVGGSVIVTGNTGSMTINLGSDDTVGGNVTVGANTGSMTIDLGSAATVGGNVTVGANTGSMTVNLGNVDTVGGNVTVNDNLGTTTVSLGSSNAAAGVTVVGNLTVTDNGDATISVDSGQVAGSLVLASSAKNVDLSHIGTGGDLTLTGSGSDTVSGQTAGGTSDVSILGGTAAMRAVIPSGAFDKPVQFTITREDAPPPAPGTGPGGGPALVQPLAPYRFAFAVPTLNADAQLTFTVDLGQLDAATKSALLEGVADGSATIAVQGDAPGASYQAFARCSAGETPAADGCVGVTLLDEFGRPATDAASAASVQFDGVAGHFSRYSVALVTPIDSSPPEIAPTVSGTLGGGGFYTSDVTVAWHVQDPESGIVARSGCDTSTLTTDTTGTTFTCSATSAGGTATQSVTVKRDATPPTITYSGNAGTYTVDQSVAITCTAVDPAPGSGLAANTCVGADGPAYTFGAGGHTLSATAGDVAGNHSSASTTFTVLVTSGGLCRLTYEFAQGSSAYKRLPASARSALDFTVAGLCNLLDQVVPRLSASQKAQLVAAYDRGLRALVLVSVLTPAQESTLEQLAARL